MNDIIINLRLKEVQAFIDVPVFTGGGGSGTSDYNFLANLPAINNVVLQGNKSADDLGLIGAEVLLDYLQKNFNSDPNINPNNYLVEWIQMIQDAVSVSVQAAILNVETGVHQIITVPIPFADETKPGIVTKEEIQGIRQNAANIETLKSASGTLTETITNLQALVSGNSQAIQNNTAAITDINSKIPSTASATNKLTTKAYVDNAVSQNAAHYLTSDANGSAFPTKAALDNATVFYYGKEEFAPTPNDYVTVLNDETRDNLTTRYAYINGVWEWTYTDKTLGGLTQEQLDALNSGATEELIEQIPVTKNALDEHKSLTDNPHQVTAEQVGLGNVKADIKTLQDNQLQSSTSPGQIYIDNKVGSVYGWDALNTEVDNLGNNKQDKLTFPLPVAMGGTGYTAGWQLAASLFPVTYANKDALFDGRYLCRSSGTGANNSFPKSDLFASQAEMQSNIGVVLYINNETGTDQYAQIPNTVARAVKTFACLQVWVARMRWFGNVTISINFAPTDTSYGRISVGWDPNGGIILPAGQYKFQSTAVEGKRVQITQLYIGQSNLQLLNGAWIVQSIQTVAATIGLNAIDFELLAISTLQSSYFQLFNTTLKCNGGGFSLCGGNYFNATGTVTQSGTNKMQFTDGDIPNLNNWFLPDGVTKAVSKAAQPVSGQYKGFQAQIIPVQDRIPA